jgi:hypothetical protein
MFLSSSLAIESHLDSVLLARHISEKTSGSLLHLWATTRPTPPAPMITTLLIMIVSSFREDRIAMAIAQIFQRALPGQELGAP